MKTWHKWTIAGLLVAFLLANVAAVIFFLNKIPDKHKNEFKEAFSTAFVDGIKMAFDPAAAHTYQFKIAYKSECIKGFQKQEGLTYEKSQIYCECLLDIIIANELQFLKDEEEFQKALVTDENTKKLEICVNTELGEK